MGSGVSVLCSKDSKFFSLALLVTSFITNPEKNPASAEYFCTLALRYFSCSGKLNDRCSIPVVFTQFLDFEECVESMFSRGLTPILLDSSPDDKCCVFYSYQPNYVVYEAKSLIIDHTTRRLPLLQCLEGLRRNIVNAMKYGKTLVVRLEKTAPDFNSVFNDVNLYNSLNGDKKIQSELERKKRGAGFVPLELFVQGGKLLRDGDEEEVISKAAALSRKLKLESTKSVSAVTRAETGYDDNSEPICSTNSSTSSSRALKWADILFREEDMKPHKNFAFCRDGFRVMLTSQLTVDEVLHLLWGWDTPAAASFEGIKKAAGASEQFKKRTSGKISRRKPHLPPSVNFGIVCVTYEDEEAIPVHT